MNLNNKKDIGALKRLQERINEALITLTRKELHNKTKTQSKSSQLEFTPSVTQKTRRSEVNQTPRGVTVSVGPQM